MKEIETTIYKCEHCGKMYQMKFYCIKHELNCRKNPANDRPCFHCACLEMKDFEYGDYDPENGDFPYKGSALFCNSRNIFVYPPYVEKHYCEEEMDSKNIPMPTKCQLMRRY